MEKPVKDLRESVNNTTEMTEEQRKAIRYYSSVLDKYFESYEELLKEETQYLNKEYKEKEEKELAVKNLKDLYTKYSTLKDEMIKVCDEYFTARIKFLNKYGEYISFSRQDESDPELINITVDTIDADEFNEELNKQFKKLIKPFF